MELQDYIGGGSVVTVASGVAYAVNKWIKPAYLELKKEIESLREENKKLLNELTEVKTQLSYLRGKYAEKTVLKSGARKDKKKKDD